MHKILVVDDDEMLREAYSYMLAAAGYEVEVAYDGANAVEQHAICKPDLMLLDMLMPNMDGLEVMHTLTKNNRLGTTKVVIFSNLSDSENIREAISLGAKKHLIKSKVSPSELVDEIATLLREPGITSRPPKQL